LNILSVKSDNPNETQLTGFQKVCELFKGGTPLEKAAQTVANEAKTKNTAKEVVHDAKGGVSNNIRAEGSSLTLSSPVELDFSASQEAAEKLPPEMREVLSKLVAKQTKKFVAGMPNATIEQVKQFQSELWHNLSLAIGYMVYESTLHHMSQPEFAEAMEAAFDA
jgi:hypothetical protein